MRVLFVVVYVYERQTRAGYARKFLGGKQFVVGNTVVKLIEIENPQKKNAPKGENALRCINFFKD